MIRVLICDDQSIVREGLRSILETDLTITVVGLAANGAQAIAAVAAGGVDVVLMDLKMPVMSGARATAEIRQRHPEVKVLVLTTYDDDEWVLDAIRAGASGYLLKDTPTPELLRAIHGTAAGKSYVDPSVTGTLLESAARGSGSVASAADVPHLTERERQMLELMAGGYSNSDIANALFLSEGTVRNYASELFRKLGVSDRTQAVVYAMRHGLVHF